MRIAIVSYEHPLGFAGGGIATYTGQLAAMLAARGHDVEVFTASKDHSGTLLHEGYTVHRVRANDPLAFRSALIPVFEARHRDRPFDVAEAAEYGADALELRAAIPDLPLVVKLHTPAYLTSLLNGKSTSITDKIRYMAGGLRRGKLVKPFWVYKKEADPEYQQCLLADAICSPSRSLAGLVQDKWQLQSTISVIPNIFVPSENLLQIPITKPSSDKIVIGFFGRLEQRKGIIELMKAIPGVLRQFPRLVFRFVGKPHPSPVQGMDMEMYMRKYLLMYQDNLEFYGYQPYERIAELLSEVHICIFLSTWENFPNVCLEAMSAGRAVIASSNGGMADMIENEHNGLLIPPMRPNSIVAAIKALVANPGLIEDLGVAARKRVLEAYNAEPIGKMVEEFYANAIMRKTLKRSTKEIELVQI